MAVASLTQSFIHGVVCKQFANKSGSIPTGLRRCLVWVALHTVEIMQKVSHGLVVGLYPHTLKLSV